MKKSLKYIIYILLIVLILNIIISIPKLIIYDDNAVNIFSNNRIIFDDVIMELTNKETFILEKKIVGYKLTIDDFKNYKYILNPSDKEYSKYTNVFDIINKLNIEAVSKCDNNISFSFNSIVELGMEIVYIQDYEKYMYGHSVAKIRKIEGNWYYVKLN